MLINAAMGRGVGMASGALGVDPAASGGMTLHPTQQPAQEIAP